MLSNLKDLTDGDMQKLRMKNYVSAASAESIIRTNFSKLIWQLKKSKFDPNDVQLATIYICDTCNTSSPSQADIDFIIKNKKSALRDYYANNISEKIKSLYAYLFLKCKNNYNYYDDEDNDDKNSFIESIQPLRHIVRYDSKVYDHGYVHSLLQQVNMDKMLIDNGQKINFKDNDFPITLEEVSEYCRRSYIYGHYIFKNETRISDRELDILEAFSLVLLKDKKATFTYADITKQQYLKFLSELTDTFNLYGCGPCDYSQSLVNDYSDSCVVGTNAIYSLRSLKVVDHSFTKRGVNDLVKWCALQSYIEHRKPTLDDYNFRTQASKPFVAVSMEEFKQTTDTLIGSIEQLDKSVGLYGSKEISFLREQANFKAKLLGTTGYEGFISSAVDFIKGLWKAFIDLLKTVYERIKNFFIGSTTNIERYVKFLDDISKDPKLLSDFEAHLKMKIPDVLPDYKSMVVHLDRLMNLNRSLPSIFEYVEKDFGLTRSPIYKDIQDLGMEFDSNEFTLLPNPGTLKLSKTCIPLAATSQDTQLKLMVNLGSVNAPITNLKSSLLIPAYMQHDSSAATWFYSIGQFKDILNRTKFVMDKFETLRLSKINDDTEKFNRLATSNFPKEFEKVSKITANFVTMIRILESYRISATVGVSIALNSLMTEYMELTKDHVNDLVK